MSTVMVTFVQATYALVTFVQISNISAVTGPILTKLFGPNLCVVIIFVDQNADMQKVKKFPLTEFLGFIISAKKCVILTSLN